MDSSLLAAIQKGKGLKKSPRRPSTARRQSAAKPAAKRSKRAGSGGNSLEDVVLVVEPLVREVAVQRKERHCCDCRR